MMTQNYSFNIYALISPNTLHKCILYTDIVLPSMLRKLTSSVLRFNSKEKYFLDAQYKSTSQLSQTPPPSLSTPLEH